jgi:hypothetical protein
MFDQLGAGRSSNLSLQAACKTQAAVMVAPPTHSCIPMACPICLHPPMHVQTIECHSNGLGLGQDTNEEIDIIGPRRNVHFFGVEQ